MKILASLMTTLFLTGCSDGKVEHYANNQPLLAIDKYFEGKISANGMIQDWCGKVIRRFRVDMEGDWNGYQGILKEHFYYDDGKEQVREWHWQKNQNDEHHFTGTADDVVGIAEGTQYGNVMNLKYRLRVPVDNKVYEFDFDDWLYLINGSVVLNKAKMKKFGFTVADLTISFNK